jgi:hypothetical protein
MHFNSNNFTKNVPRVIKIAAFRLNLYPNDNYQSKLAAIILVLTYGSQKSYTHYYGWMGPGEG